MGYSKSVYDRADRILNERRLSAQRNAEKLRLAFYEANPKALEIEEQLSHTFTEIARTVMSGDKEQLGKIKEKNLALQQELKRLYDEAGVNEKALSPHYVCEKCSDKGNIDGVVCQCYEKLVKQIACDDLNRRSPLSLCDFESFELKYYPEENRRKMSNIFNYCVEYANTFSQSSDSIVMTGGTGLGKTHLALSIANRVINNGSGVIYISAPEMVSALEEYQFGREQSSTEITARILSECDLLIIDDLGTEFVTAFSKSAVYNVFNLRITKGKPTIISTNLSIAELEKNYTDRFVSRISGYCRILFFEGSDIRIQKKMEERQK